VFPTEKSSKRGMFLRVEKRGVSSPRFTTKPPQSDHQNTTFCTSLFAKTPAKNTLPPRQHLFPPLP
jgi:hypothetical protein